jgi:dihydroorotase
LKFEVVFGYLRIMKALIRQARIVSPDSPFHSLKKDLLIQEGIIVEISDQISVEADVEIRSENLHVSVGWTDLFAQIPDPGNEYRETMQTGARAAAHGGFTDVCLTPNTNPPVSTKSQVEYIRQQSTLLPVNFHPIGAISKGTEGKELAEMYDLLASGAVCFSDGFRPVQQPNLLIKALQYVKQHQGFLIQMPDEKSLSAHGLMHEGMVSTRMGLPGKPAIAEELMISRDIELLRYTNSRLHITGVSTRNGLNLIADAKKQGLNLTCSVTPYHLVFTENDLTNYDTNLKVNPPLRTEDDRLALIEGIKNGIVDAISTHHIPLHEDEKNCPFEEAHYGMNGFETMFSLLVRAIGYDDAWINCLTTNPRSIAGMSQPRITEGSTACLTVFDPIMPVTYTATKLKSKSKNSPCLNTPFTGGVLGIINKNQVVVS